MKEEVQEQKGGVYHFTGKTKKEDGTERQFQERVKRGCNLQEHEKGLGMNCPWQIEKEEDTGGCWPSSK